MRDTFNKLLGYHAWANRALLEKLAEIDAVANAAELDAALRIVNHYHIVARIFSAHLSGLAHGFLADNTPEPPDLIALDRGLSEIDRWYLDYLEHVTGPELAEPISFSFTDGDRGMMTRAEMLTHVTLHGGYHRGEVGRILGTLGITPPWDTYAVYLHRTEPRRREQKVCDNAF